MESKSTLHQMAEKYDFKFELHLPEFWLHSLQPKS